MTSDSGDGKKDDAPKSDGEKKPERRRPRASKDKPDEEKPEADPSNPSDADKQADYTAIDDSLRGAERTTRAKAEERALFRSLFPDEVELNSRAHRWMRWLAFLCLGSITCAYLVVLLLALRSFLSGKTLAAIVGASSLPTDWHMLVLMGIVFVIFAAVPLSLAMSLVKMISEKNEDAAGFKTPTTEAGKLFLDFCKGIISK